MEVIEATDRTVLVLGGPGTGKTTTALWAAREELNRTTIARWQRVLFLTFSRTAVAQIGKRAPHVFGSDGHRIEIATFHGFGWRLIRSFGRYAGYGVATPTLQSRARIKLLGQDRTLLSYDDLIPLALAILKSDTLRALVSRRWPLIICDEFQDTDDDQWTLLTTLGAAARLVLLADPNQMIYAFLKERGVNPERLQQVRSVAGRVVTLESGSHRDPTFLIPAMAEAIRRRQFGDAAVKAAVRSDRLLVIPRVEDDSLPSILSAEITRLRSKGARTIGVFGHSNEGVATLSAALTEIGLDHVLVGISEAHAEALAALVTLCGYGAATKTEADVRIALAMFLTACTRGARAPLLASALSTGRQLPPKLEQRLSDLLIALREQASGGIADLIAVACTGWNAIGIVGGVRPWRRACVDFGMLLRHVSALPTVEAAVGALINIVQRRRASVLVEFDAARLGTVQLMNFHQTKGREADAVVLVYRDGDYLADRNDAEPYEEPSKVLFVSLTRARTQVIVILPSFPHPVVAPFAALSGT